MRHTYITFIVLLFSYIGASAVYEESFSADDKIDYNTFKYAIEKKGVTTLEQALSLAPKEYYDHYVLVYRSRSLQEASFLHPRAIVFGKTGRFIMAFNGHEKQKGYNNLEIIQYDEPRRRWQFHEIVFNPGQKPKFINNPKKCIECHQSPKRMSVDLRPNWEPYNFWPGVYGSVDKKLKASLIEPWEKFLRGEFYGSTPIRGLQKDDGIMVYEQAQEQDMLTKYNNEIKPTSERYSHLGTFDVFNNLRMTDSLTALNMNRVVRLMYEELGEELFNIYKYTIYGLGMASHEERKNYSLYLCYKLYMPKNVFAEHFRYTPHREEIARTTRIKPKNWRHNWEIDLDTGIEIIFSPLGVLTEDWSMDFKTGGRFAFRTRFGAAGHSKVYYRNALLRSFPEEPTNEMDCSSLGKAAEKSLQAFYHSGGLQKVLREAQRQPKRHEKPLIQRCIRCHADQEDPSVPYIPFDNFSLLAPRLVAGDYPRGSLFEEVRYRTGTHAIKKDQMPPAGRFSNEARQSFMDTMESVLESVEF